MAKLSWKLNTSLPFLLNIICLPSAPKSLQNLLFLLICGLQGY